MTTNPLRNSVRVAAAMFALALAGCTDKASSDNVDRRAIERWNYLVAHQADKAYDYLTPGFRQTKTREDYASAMNDRPLQWKSVTFNRKECDDDRCTVYVDVAYTLKMPGSAGSIDTTSTQSEIWIRVDGEWYYLPK